MDAGRGVHSRPQRRSAPAQAPSGTTPLQNDRIRRPTALPRRRRPAEILRFHLPEVPPVPHRKGRLKLVTYPQIPPTRQILKSEIVNKNTSTSLNVTSRGGKQGNDILDSLVGLV